MVLFVLMNEIEFEKAKTEKKISQRKIASILHMSPQRLSDMKAGRIKGYKYRFRLCKFFGIDEEILFSDDS